MYEDTSFRARIATSAV